MRGGGCQGESQAGVQWGFGRWKSSCNNCTNSLSTSELQCCFTFTSRPSLSALVLTLYCSLCLGKIFSMAFIFVTLRYYMPGSFVLSPVAPPFHYCLCKTGKKKAKQNWVVSSFSEPAPISQKGNNNFTENLDPDHLHPLWLYLEQSPSQGQESQKYF